MLFAQLSSETEGVLLAGALVLLTVVWLSRTAIWGPRAVEESETDRYPAEGASLTGVGKSSTETLSLEARGSSYSFCEQVRHSYSPRFCRQVLGTSGQPFVLAPQYVSGPPAGQLPPLLIGNPPQPQVVLGHLNRRTETEQLEHDELEAAWQAVKEVEECLAHLAEVRRQEVDSSR